VDTAELVREAGLTYTVHLDPVMQTIVLMHKMVTVAVVSMVADRVEIVTSVEILVAHLAQVRLAIDAMMAVLDQALMAG
jgi:hypothetical protein